MLDNVGAFPRRRYFTGCFEMKPQGVCEGICSFMGVEKKIYFSISHWPTAWHDLSELSTLFCVQRFTSTTHSLIIGEYFQVIFLLSFIFFSLMQWISYLFLFHIHIDNNYTQSTWDPWVYGPKKTTIEEKPWILRMHRVPCCAADAWLIFPIMPLTFC
jgi:hypothetical protein